jgi:hypothetical protein
MTRVEKFVAAEAVRVKVDYKLPRGSMVVSPDVFSRIRELADLDQMDAFYEHEVRWLKNGV